MDDILYVVNNSDNVKITYNDTILKIPYYKSV